MSGFDKQLLLWIGFNLFVLLMLALDLGIFNRKAHVISFKEAMTWSAVWISLSLLFCLGIYLTSGSEPSLEFLTGYLIEKSLSVDNIFIFLMIFSYFRVPPIYQHKILFWGVIGALAMRAVFIVAGISLIERFHEIIYVFGGLLVLTGIKMSQHHDKEIHPEKNLVVKLARKLIPITKDFQGSKFFVKERGRWAATPLFLVLIIVETSDLIFAVDSIPAILAISQEPFLVYTSNVFAILGLRSLYFALAGIITRFHLIHYGLSAILIFVGVKMLIMDIYKVPVGISLLVIALILGTSIGASIKWPKKAEEKISVNKNPKHSATG